MAKSNSYFNMDMLVLSVLKQGDCYGYEIVRKISHLSTGIISIREGTLYPILYTLQKKGYISSDDVIVSKKVRVYYHIEPSGIEYYNEVSKKFRENIQGVYKILEYGDKGLDSE